VLKVLLVLELRAMELKAIRALKDSKAIKELQVLLQA